MGGEISREKLSSWLTGERAVAFFQGGGRGLDQEMIARFRIGPKTAYSTPDEANQARLRGQLLDVHTKASSCAG